MRRGWFAAAHHNLPKLSRRGARGPMIGGQALCALGYLLLCTVDARSDYVFIGVVFLGIGTGGGLIVPAMTAAMLETVGGERSGIASGLLNAGRQMGAVVGIAVFGSHAARFGLVDGLHHAVLLAALAMVVGVGLSLVHGRPYTADRPGGPQIKPENGGRP